MAACRFLVQRSRIRADKHTNGWRFASLCNVISLGPFRSGRILAVRGVHGQTPSVVPSDSVGGPNATAAIAGFHARGRTARGVPSRAFGCIAVGGMHSCWRYEPARCTPEPGWGCQVPLSAEFGRARRGTKMASGTGPRAIGSKPGGAIVLIRCPAESAAAIVARPPARTARNRPRSTSDLGPEDGLISPRGSPGLGSENLD